MGGLQFKRFVYARSLAFMVESTNVLRCFQFRSFKISAVIQDCVENGLYYMGIGLIKFPLRFKAQSGFVVVIMKKHSKRASFSKYENVMATNIIKQSKFRIFYLLFAVSQTS